MESHRASERASESGESHAASDLGGPHAPECACSRATSTANGRTHVGTSRSVQGSIQRALSRGQYVEDLADVELAEWERAHQGYEPVAGGWGKRGFDLACVLVALPLALPLIFAVAMLVKLTSPGPILYWSERIGRFGQTFWMPKFRTMVVGTPLVPREEMGDARAHLTPIGDFLRRSSLDELPQLLSILRGHMSIIGPRPLLAKDPASAARRCFPAALLARPGLTGLAQINGRNLVTPRRKARYDALYVTRWCWGLEARIFFKSVRIVLARSGVL